MNHGPHSETDPAYAVERADLVQTVVASGRVESPQRVEIASTLTGTVIDIPVREGQAVEAGQLLVALDARSASSTAPTPGASSSRGARPAPSPRPRSPSCAAAASASSFQYHYLIAAFSAIENVMMPLLLDRGRPDARMRGEAAALLDRVGLAAFADKPVNHLSGGQQQRVAVARALAMGAPLILADEPTGNLDTKPADGVFELMRSVNVANATTFLIVTHDPWLAARCDRLVELVDGHILRDAPVPRT